jgi:trk system potassium uptake protein TrkA
MPVGGTGPVRKIFQDVEVGAEHVVIAGGGTTALMLAQILESGYVDVTLIEERLDRCEYLSKVLKSTRVIHGDATRKSVLEEERVGNAGVFIALCGIDEVNLMSSLQAKAMGVPHMIVSVNRGDYVPLVEQVGIDHAVSPRILTGNRILSLAGQAHFSSMALLQDEDAEVVEIEAQDGAPAVNKIIGEEVQFPNGTIIGAVVRGDEVIVPRGGDSILPGDTVIAFSLSTVVEEFGGLFNP